MKPVAAKRAPLASVSVRIKPIAPRHRIAHLRALIAREPAGSRRRRELNGLLRHEIAGRAD